MKKLELQKIISGSVKEVLKEYEERDELNIVNLIIKLCSESIRIDNIIKYKQNIKEILSLCKNLVEMHKKEGITEVAPPGFGSDKEHADIYKKVKAQYTGEPEKAYSTMWKIYKNIK